MQENKVRLRSIASKWGSIVVLLLVLILFCMYFQDIKNYFEAKNGTLGTWDQKYTLFNLVKQHLYVTCISSVISLVIGGAMGLFCTSAMGRDLKGIMEKTTPVYWKNEDLDIPTYSRRKAAIDNGKLVGE